MNKEQAQNATETALQDLVKALEQGKSDELIKYLTCMSRFHQYSLRNLLLISHQQPEATQVAGFHTWRKLKRSVRKGEKGIAILAPLAFRKKTKGTPEDESEQAIAGFRVVHVFDIKQTDGPQLPELVTPTGDPGIALAQLEDVIRGNGIELENQDLPPDTHGCSMGGKIIVNCNLSAAERFSVLAHELAHEWLEHHLARCQDKRIRETEAEAVAFVVGTAHGINCEQSSADYIMLYRGDSEALSRSLKEIQRVASRILQEIAC